MTFEIDSYRRRAPNLTLKYSVNSLIQVLSALPDPCSLLEIFFIPLPLQTSCFQHLQPIPHRQSVSSLCMSLGKKKHVEESFHTLPPTQPLCLHLAQRFRPLFPWMNSVRLSSLFVHWIPSSHMLRDLTLAIIPFPLTSSAFPPYCIIPMNVPTCCDFSHLKNNTKQTQSLNSKSTKFLPISFS